MFEGGVYILSVDFCGLGQTTCSENEKSVNVKMTRYYTMGKTRSNRARLLNKTARVYTDSHYSSNDGMLTTVWGPGMWHYLHTMSFNYPVAPTCDEKRHYQRFVLSLQHVLPCGKCRRNLTRTLRQFPLI